jgi:hypothetical protein
MTDPDHRQNRRPDAGGSYVVEPDGSYRLVSATAPAPTVHERWLAAQAAADASDPAGSDPAAKDKPSAEDGAPSTDTPTHPSAESDAAPRRRKP